MRLFEKIQDWRDRFADYRARQGARLEAAGQHVGENLGSSLGWLWRPFTALGSAIARGLVLLRRPVDNFIHWFRVRRQQVQLPQGDASESRWSATQIHARWWEPIAAAWEIYRATRPAGQLAWGIPALLVLVLLLGATLVLTGIRPAATRTVELRRQGGLAEGLGNFARARIAYERLIKSGQNDMQTRYDLARCLLRCGERERALQLIYALAPEDRLGFSPAHLDRARLILSKNRLSPDDVEKAEKHLNFVLKDRNDRDALVLALLGEIRRRQATQLRLESAKLADARQREAAREQAEKYLNEAYQKFAAASVISRQYCMLAATIARDLGLKKEAQEQARAAAGFFLSVLSDAKGETRIEVILAHAQALQIQERYADAAAELDKRLQETGHPRVRGALLAACAEWIKVLETGPTPDEASIFTCVEMVLRAEPQEQRWQQRLLGLVNTRGSQIQAQAENFMKKLSEQRQACAPVEFYLGGRAFSVARYDVARQHWERCYELAPEQPAVLNNLACVLVKPPNPDAARALKLVDRAIALQPKSAEFQQTRGEVLKELGRYAEAIAVFEKIVPITNDRKTVYRFMADCYQALRLGSKAEEYRRKAGLDN